MIDISIIFESIRFIQPEIAAAIAICLVVMTDLLSDSFKKYLPYVSGAGIVVIGLLVIQQMDVTASAFLTNPSHKMGMVSVDAMSIFFKLFILVSTLLILVFSVKSAEINAIPQRQGEYYTLIMGMVLGMLLMVSATDFILIYLAMELLSLSSYVLAGITKLRDRNSEASLKYIIYGAAASGLMLFGISLIFGLTGSTNLYDINCAIQNQAMNPVLFSFAAILVVVGIGYKISAVPFHFWTPDVYEGAPLPITAYLSVASKAAGFAILVRIIYSGFMVYSDDKGGWHLSPVFDWYTILLVISIATMSVGNLVALWQNNLKRMLAYSSIAHAGYMLMAVAAFSGQALAAIMVYFVFYMIMNLGAFFVVMLIADKTGKEEIHDYDGLGPKIPFLSASLVVFLISLVGLPPTAGFIGKLQLFSALLDAKMIWPAIIAVLNSVISLYYYIRVVKHMYLSKKDESEIPDIKIDNFSKYFVIALAVLTIYFGLFFAPVLSFIKDSVEIFGL